jgi:hypothetical protein
MRSDEMLPVVKAPRGRCQIREGLRYAAHTPELLLPLVRVTITGILASEFTITLPLLAEGAFGGNAASYGVMAAVMASGAIISGRVAASRSRPRHSTSSVSRQLDRDGHHRDRDRPQLPADSRRPCVCRYGSITFNSTTKSAVQLASAR